jgi:hypothetical protein
MKTFLSTLILAGASLLAQAGGSVGTTLPEGFPVIEDASLQKPVIGFGAAGIATRTPVIFLHGNNDTPFPTACSPFGNARAFAQHLADNGWQLQELWGLGYQGDQCDLAAARPSARASRTATRPMCPTCAASCRRCWRAPARARSTSSPTAWA